MRTKISLICASIIFNVNKINSTETYHITQTYYNITLLYDQSKLILYKLSII